MPNLTKRIQELRTLYNKHKSTGLKEIPSLYIPSAILLKQNQ